MTPKNYINKRQLLLNIPWYSHEHVHLRGKKRPLPFSRSVYLLTVSPWLITRPLLSLAEREYYHLLQQNRQATIPFFHINFFSKIYRPPRLKTKLQFQTNQGKFISSCKGWGRLLLFWVRYSLCSCVLVLLTKR